ncbi:MAG: hypothetical protein B6D58_03520 [candidate division Zixibacteria bacterium 4484_95]|nr:MAG: hypothetical protein B6D58_03520 [candidate division Zixibacteria bacterium 4484_95]
MKIDSTKYILPYLPDILIKSFSKPQTVQQDITITGSLLFADLSGFTAISERLASLGRLGAEKLAGIINNRFNLLLGVVFAYGGDVIKFGGDAFLAFFSGTDNTSRAYMCAGDLIHWITENGRISTPVGDFSLGIHAGISAGDIYNLYIGDKRKEHLFCGLTVENAYMAADTAGLGQVALTKHVASSINGIDITELENGFCICRKLHKSNKIKFATRQGWDDIFNKSTKPLDENLERFVINGLKERLNYNAGVIEGEHRVLTSLFIGVSSLRANLEADSKNSVSAINNYFTTINEIIEKHGGAFARLDSSHTSEKMLAFFGAPVSSGHDTENCLKAIIEIQSILSKLNENFVIPVKHRYGVNTGLCFVGDVGGASRREYTAMGDAINLAARLMTEAKYGDVLVGEKTITTCGEKFITSGGDLVPVKGKAEPVRLYYLEDQITRGVSPEQMIGREDELKQAQEFINKVIQGNPSQLLIAGEPGTGKSLLCANIKQMAARAGLHYTEGACFKYSEKTPYEPLKTILSGFLNLTSRASQKQRKQALLRYLKKINESEWEPLIAPLFDYFPPAPPQLKNLPEDIKKEKIRNILCRLFCEINKNRLSLLIMEDVQWVDNASFEIIESLLGKQFAPGVVFLCRPGDTYEKLKNKSGVRTIKLAGLSRENSQKLFLSVLKDIVPNQDIIERVIEKSGGNPFYLEEMAKAFRELGAKKFSSCDNIPSGIESVITARIDNLGEAVKKTVRTASVIGRVFAYNVLCSIYPDRKRIGKLRGYLDELSHLDLTPLERRQPVLEYMFKHILTQEVAYNGLPFSIRRTLHLKTAEYFANKKRKVKCQPEIPARHFLLAGEDKRALPYLLLAGKKAAAEFANTEAIKFFTKALQIAEKHNANEYILKILQSRGRLAKHTSDFKLAESDYLRLKDISGEDLSKKVDALCNLSEIYRQIADYDKAEKTMVELEELMPDDPHMKVFWLNCRAEIARRRGKLQDCRRQLCEALSLAKTFNSPADLVAQIYNNLGICHWSLGKLKESAGYYKSALALYRQLKDLGGQSKIINNLGIINDEMGRLCKAAKSYEKAQKIFERIGATRSRAYACANLGTNLTSRGYLAQAVEKLNLAREIFRKIGDQYSLAYTEGDIGFVYFCWGDFEKAMDYFNKALDIGLNLKNDEFILETKLRISKLMFFKGDLKSEDISSFTKIAQQVGSNELEMRSKILSGWLYLKSADLIACEEIINGLKNIARLNNSPEIEIEISKLQVMLLSAKGIRKTTSRLLKSSLQKAIKKDLALVVLELMEIGEACGLISDIPEKLTSKIITLKDRMEKDVNSSISEKIKVSHKRKIEFMRAINHRCKISNKQDKILEISHKVM